MAQKFKYFLFSLVLILMTFGVAEGVSRLFFPTGADDFIERMKIEQNLEHRKRPGEFRIFLFGESTMHGSHLYPDSTINKWMKLYLDELLPREMLHNLTIVNFGRLGENSYFFYRALQDTLAWKPDLLVFYSAHNDFIQLEKRRESLQGLPFGEAVHRYFRNLIKRSAFLSQMNRNYIGFKNRRKQRKKAKVREAQEDPVLEEVRSKKYNPETDLMAPDSEEMQLLLENWKANIQKIIRLAQKHGVPVVFFKGIANYRDLKPSESVHPDNLADKEKERAEQLLADGVEYLEAGRLESAERSLLASLAIDKQYAITHYRLGEVYEAMGRFEEAGREYKLANDLDYFIIRAPSSVNAFYTKLQNQKPEGVHIIETEKIFEERSANGIIGMDLIPDQVHPSIQGQAIMAREIIQILYENEYFTGKENWDWENLPEDDVLREKLGIDSYANFMINIRAAHYFGRHFDKKIAFLTKALEYRPDSQNARRRLAWAYWESGQTDKALAIYRVLERDNPEMVAGIKANFPEIAKALNSVQR